MSTATAPNTQTTLPWREALAESMEQSRAFEYIPMPGALWFTEAIPATMRDVLAYMMYCHKTNQPTRATAAACAEYINRPPSTVYRALKRLVDEGLLERTRIDKLPYGKVYVPANEALKLVSSIGKKIPARTTGTKDASHGRNQAQKTSARAAAKGASQVKRAVKATKTPKKPPVPSEVPYREKLRELMAVSLRTPKEKDIPRIEAAWTELTRDMLPDRILLAYQAYSQKLVDKDDIMFARSLANWLEDKNTVRALVAKVAGDAVGEGKTRKSTGEKGFSIENQRRRVEMLAIRATTDPEAAVAVAEHRAAWAWLPGLMKKLHVENNTDISGVLSVIRRGVSEEVDLDNLRTALVAEIKVRELFDRLFPNQEDVLVKEKPLQPANYGILDLEVEQQDQGASQERA